jgi:tetratricopeptide (TPR) repeat protein
MRRRIHLAILSVTVLTAAVLVGCNSTWVSSGLLYQEQGNYAKAETMFRTGLWYDEKDAAAHYHLAYTLAYRAENDHLATGELDSAQIKIAEAHRHYLTAAELDPEKYEYNPDAENEADRTPSENGIASMYARMYNEGVRLMNQDRIDEALTYFELARAADPRGKRGFDADLLMAQLRFNQSQGDEQAVERVWNDLEAIQVPEDSESPGQDAADLVRVKAQVLTSLGRNAEAALLYEELLRNNPDDLALIQRVAQARVEQGDRASAGELYERAVTIAESDPELGPEDRFAIAFQAAINYREGEMYEKCIAMCDRSLAFASTDAERGSVQRTKARSYYELERWPEAIEAVEPIVRDGGYDPTNLEAWQIYYLSLNQAGREEEAIAARERFIQLRDNPAGR